METALKRLEETIKLLEQQGNSATYRKLGEWLRADLKLIRAFVPAEGE